MSKEIRIGIFGVSRGSSFFESILANNGNIVAICEKHERRAKEAVKRLGKVAVYDNFDEFIKHPMDAVILANYFHEHAEYAIRCLEKGIHVLSECTAAATLADAVKLVRAAEKSDAFIVKICVFRQQGLILFSVAVFHTFAATDCAQKLSKKQRLTCCSAVQSCTKCLRNLSLTTNRNIKI